MGTFKFDNNVFFAPMAGFSDLTFRRLCKEQGAGLVFTEMISAKGLFYNNDNTKELLETTEDEWPTAVQIFGSDPLIMADMAKKIAEEYPFDMVNINMGCPANKIVKNGDGSALMKNPELVKKIVDAVVKKVKKPVTVKIRKGFDEGNVNAVLVAKMAEEAGACGVIVHGRTREQFYSGLADWDIIKEVKENVKIHVTGNGDVVCPISAKKMLDYTGVDAIMIGRGACGNPWVFKRVSHFLETGEILQEPTLDEKIKMILRHTTMLIEKKGEYMAVREMRKHIGFYIKGLKNATDARLSVNKAKTYKDIEEALFSYLL
ncbi:MAG: tRNA dihydrouridine synthase DusB [Defluviitaleaceae bacterium]|nr:tRNA dihydrouridine synthase DusB [Defluviitaleaceae bacterium]